MKRKKKKSKRYFNKIILLVLFEASITAFNPIHFLIELDPQKKVGTYEIFLIKLCKEKKKLHKGGKATYFFNSSDD